MWTDNKTPNFAQTLEEKPQIIIRFQTNIKEICSSNFEQKKTKNQGFILIATCDATILSETKESFPGKNTDEVI